MTTSPPFDRVGREGADVFWRRHKAILQRQGVKMEIGNPQTLGGARQPNQLLMKAEAIGL